MNIDNGDLAVPNSRVPNGVVVNDGDVLKKKKGKRKRKRRKRKRKKKT